MEILQKKKKKKIDFRLVPANMHGNVRERLKKQTFSSKIMVGENVRNRKKRLGSKLDNPAHLVQSEDETDLIGDWKATTTDARGAATIGEMRVQRARERWTDV